MASQEEYLDVLNEKGELIGPMPRSEVHKRGLWHRVIHLWIANSKGELVIQQRAMCKESFPGLWDISVAGHMSSGDEPRVACQREAEEELGLKIADEEMIHVFSTKHQFVLRNGAYIDNEFVEVFIVIRDLDLNSVTLQESEVMAVKYMDYKEVQRLSLTPNGGFSPVHTDYQPFWDFMEKTFPK